MAIAVLQKDHPVYQAFLLASACAIVGVALIAGHEATHESILTHEREDQISTLNQVLPAGSYDNNPLDEKQTYEHSLIIGEATLMAARLGDDMSATVIQQTISGWGGPLQMMVATDPSGEILGVRVISHKDTPGLADKIELDKSDWILGFEGHSLANTSEKQWAVKKDGGDFDQFTGATITPRAVVRGVHSALEIQQRWQDAQETANASAPAGETP